MTGKTPDIGPLPSKGIKCLGYSGQKYYLIGEITPEVQIFTSTQIMRRAGLCELRTAADWKAEAKGGKVDWEEEGSRLLAACQKAGQFHVDKPSPKKPKANGHAIDMALVPYDAWIDQLQRGERGYRPNDFNVTVALTLCPQLAGKIGWDVRQLAFVAVADSPAGPPGPWSDSHTARLAVWLQSQDIPVTTRHVETALAASARGNFVDPLGAYLNGLEWDGQERIGTWLAHYCQAERLDANSIMGSKFLIGAVARALRPGCQMDTMLVLEGDQGKKKSSAIRILGGPFTSENLPDFHSKDAQQIIGSKWIVEVSELAAIGKSELEAVKAFITRREDTFRPPYGRHPITVPRWSVFIGNYNPDGVGVLQDSTGGRRFWIAAVNDIDCEALARDRDQLWAEAVYCFNRGDQWWLTDTENLPVREQQSDRTDDDSWMVAIRTWADEELPSGELRLGAQQTFTTTDIAVSALGFRLQDVNRSVQMRVARCFHSLGFKRTRDGPPHARYNCYVRR